MVKRALEHEPGSLTIFLRRSVLSLRCTILMYGEFQTYNGTYLGIRQWANHLCVSQYAVSTSVKCFPVYRKQIVLYPKYKPIAVLSASSNGPYFDSPPKRFIWWECCWERGIRLIRLSMASWTQMAIDEVKFIVSSAGCQMYETRKWKNICQMLVQMKFSPHSISISDIAAQVVSLSSSF